MTSSSSGRRRVFGAAAGRGVGAGAGAGAGALFGTSSPFLNASRRFASSVSYTHLTLPTTPYV